MSYYRLPFNLKSKISAFDQLPFGSDVYVISDSEYKKYRQNEALKEIDVLEGRAVSYEKAAESIRRTIAELREENDLLLSNSETVMSNTDNPSE